MNEISCSLVKSYLFISGKIENAIYLEESLKRINDVWRQYHTLDEIEVI